MKLIPVLLCVGLTGLLVGCASVDSRIRKGQVDFDRWPAEVQAAIRAERVEVGFTPEQVEMALGRPSRVYTRTTAAGEEEIWAYYERKPGFSFGMAVGSGGYQSTAGGVTYDRRYDSLDDATRIVFKDGWVTSVELRKT